MNDVPFDLPADLARIAAAYEFRKAPGCSGAQVFRLEKPGGANVYLKIAERDNGDLAAERAVLNWINGRLPAPAVEWYGHSELQSSYQPVKCAEWMLPNAHCLRVRND